MAGATSNPDPRIERYFWYYSYKKQEMSASEIVQKLDFGSPQALYHRLAHDGFPVCSKCGSTPEKSDHCEVRRKRKESKERKARSSGEAVELPAASNAERLFRKDIEQLTQYVDDLHNLRETLQGERFVSSSWVADDWEWFYRADFLEEDWRKLCEEASVNPEADEHYLQLRPSAVPEGVHSSPSESLTRLIALHALVNGSMNSLVNVLHPYPDEINWKRLNEQLYGHHKDPRQRGHVKTLRHGATQLAKLVRGGDIRRGPPPPSITRRQQWIYWYLIRPLANESYTNEQILTSLVEKGHLDEDEYNVDDIGWLRNLRLPFPD